jgi:hypothetical protein
MPNEMFTQLPTATPQLTDIICAVQGFTGPSNLGLSVQETLGQVLQLMLSNTILVNNGNPNGSLAGQTFQLCWDTADKLLWVCTTTGSSSSAVWTTVVGTFTNGQILIGATGAAPQPGTITAGSNISIANGANSITISTTGAPGIGWTDVTGTSQIMSPDSGYLANNAGLVTLTLPTVSAFGQFIYVQGFGSGGWTIAQNAGQNIQVGSSSTTVGVGGSLSSSNRYDSILLLTAVANTTFTSLGAPQSAGLTIV